tara:strand:- start:7649 stop:7759 length:111 start_codon:yes stop_codon:yes gene_type:complete
MLKDLTEVVIVLGAFVILLMAIMEIVNAVIEWTRRR